MSLSRPNNVGLVLDKSASQETNKDWETNKVSGLLPLDGG